MPLHYCAHYAYRTSLQTQAHRMSLRVILKLSHCTFGYIILIIHISKVYPNTGMCNKMQPYNSPLHCAGPQRQPLPCVVFHAIACVFAFTYIFYLIQYMLYLLSDCIHTLSFFLLYTLLGHTGSFYDQQ